MRDFVETNLLLLETVDMLKSYSKIIVGYDGDGWNTPPPCLALIVISVLVKNGVTIDKIKIGISQRADYMEAISDLGKLKSQGQSGDNYELIDLNDEWSGGLIKTFKMYKDIKGSGGENVFDPGLKDFLLNEANAIYVLIYDNNKKDCTEKDAEEKIGKLKKVPGSKTFGPYETTILGKSINKVQIAGEEYNFPDFEDTTGTNKDFYGGYYKKQNGQKEALASTKGWEKYVSEEGIGKKGLIEYWEDESVSKEQDKYKFSICKNTYDNCNDNKIRVNPKEQAIKEAEQKREKERKILTEAEQNLLKRQSTGGYRKLKTKKPKKSKRKKSKSKRSKKK